MTLLLVCLGLLALLFLSAVFSGSETGVYSLSRVRLVDEARHGMGAARLLERLARNESMFLITLLIGNNLMLELLTHGFEGRLLPRDLPPGTRELLVTLLLTPTVFLAGELVPKDVFRRRPHRFLFLSVPVLSVARVVFLPLALPIYAITLGLERVFGLRERALSRAFRREEMIEILEEGTRAGALTPKARELAHNVLVLRETPVQRVMVPWDRVRTVDLDLDEEAARTSVEDAGFTRLPVLRRDRSRVPRVVGYVNQLEVLATDRSVLERVRDLPRIAPETPLDRALSHLRGSEQRLALVGTAEKPEGLLTLMDLLAAISR